MQAVDALERFVEWMRGYAYLDRNRRLPDGLRLQYHSRSDEHSKRLGALIAEDLLDRSELIREQAARGDIAFGINYPYKWPNGKPKTIDLALGVPMERQEPLCGTRIRRLVPKRGNSDPSQQFARLLISLEAKAVMTEHGKSQPRVYSELNDSHAIVHGGDAEAIAAAITMVNIANSFISPLRQGRGRPIAVTRHNQPAVAENMIKHLRGLPQRDESNEIGLDAYCTFVVDADNQGNVELHTGPPAPQSGDPDAYDIFIERIVRFYEHRFNDLQHLPQARPLSVEEALGDIAQRYPELIRSTARFLRENPLPGSDELESLLNVAADKDRWQE